MDSNLFWCIIGIVGGAIFSFIISLFFYFIGLKRKKLIYQIETSNVISYQINKIENLKVTYCSETIENLYLSTIIIKNTSNSIIEKQDFVPSHPIALSTNGRFLTDEIDLFSTDKDNKISLSFNTNNLNQLCNHIIINFDYIAPNEQFTCSFFHTNNIKFDGKLKYGKVIQKYHIIYSFIFSFAYITSKMIYKFYRPKLTITKKL